MWTKSLILLLACVVFVNADTDKQSGACPDVPAEEHFDAVKFADGKWYLVLHNDPTDYSCGEAEIHLSPEKSFDISGVKNGVKFSRSIPFTTISPGVFEITGTGEFDGISKVLATDYTNYAVSYACVYDASDDTHRDRVAIQVRGQHAEHPEEMIATAKAAIEGKDVHPHDLKPVPHTDCDHEHHHHHH